ncbi:MAG: ribosome recycling factor [Treponema sp.]|nr:MAG: ribosome recycling factor [Treponema sp.]
MDSVYANYEAKMKKSVESLQNEFNSLRTGRASASLFDKVRVDCYGEQTPLNQVASISIPEARLVVIQPWDKNLLADIEKAIMKSELSLNPSNDGKVIRISIPPLTDERRADIVKQAKSTAEKTRVSIRNLRRDGIDEAKKMQKDGNLSEDELKVAGDKFQTMTDKFIAEINKILEEKEKEILEG